MKSTLLSLAMCLCLLVVKAQPASAPEVKEFEVFWKKLYTAIVKKDYNAVSQYIEFPLVVKKNLADNTVQTIGRQEFPRFFSGYLDMPAKDEFVNKYGLLRARKALSEDDKTMVDEDSATIEDFEFQKVDGEWKLVYVYATTNE
ncbi:hypothetical protein ACFOTA_10895 [Chitinophaga sp. GCM10012297]|uniref:DUF4348 domain-containing protein n=1 Tax=Chitinophaga chungangae TaxID=2821488 RepID=A0ABS3YDI4_9BACT|nr:hypothetical protein [Chitinophaga chungangae]MBO9152716.1 hypothetical protein [Chitinophaga chungangae]